MANISEPQLIRLIDAHIKKECPNYYKGFCDAKDKPCSWRREEEPFTNRGITCGWLRDAVLPLDKELRGFYENWKQVELARREKKDTNTSGETDVKAPKVDVCVGCRKPMVVRSVRQKYCDACRETQRRIKVAAAVRKHRNKSSQM
jgi:hypothetical protein